MHDDSESVTSAATRAWARVPAATRRKFTGKTGAPAVAPARIWRSLLYRVVVDCAPALRPVVRQKLNGVLTAEQAELLVAAVVGQSQRLERAGDWVAGIRGAHAGMKPRRRADGLTRLPSVTALADRVYPVCWDLSARDIPVDPDECARLYREFTHDDPYRSPPTNAALRALLQRPEAVSELEAIISAHWAEPTGTGGGEADRAATGDAVAALLDAPAGADWDRLWGRYAALRPWERHLTQAHMTGLSERAVPERPQIGGEAVGDGNARNGAGVPDTAAADSAEEPKEHRWAGEILARAEGGVRPLDRSLWQRLDQPIRRLPGREDTKGMTAALIAHAEARRACAPLGLADDDLRTVLCLGNLAASAVGADHAKALMDNPATGPRLMVELARIAQGREFVKQTLRLGATQHAPVRRALDEPVPGFTRLLWRTLHNIEIRQESPPAPQDRFRQLIRGTAARFIQVLSGEIKLVLDDRVPLEAEHFVPAGHSITEISDAYTADAPPRPNHEPEIDVLVIDAVVDGNADHGTEGAELHAWVERFVDPLHKRWAEQAWDELYSAYCVKHAGKAPDGKAVEFSAIPFTLARDIVRNVYRRGTRTGGAR